LTSGAGKRELSRLMKAQGGRTAAAALATLVTVGALYGLAHWAGGFVPLLLSDGDFRPVIRSAGWGVLLLAVVTAGTALRDVSLVSLAADCSSSVRMRMLQALVRQPVAAGRALSRGEALTRVAGDVVLLHQALVRAMAIWLPAAVTSVVLLAAVVVASPRLALATAVLVAPALAVVARAGGRLQGVVRLTQESTAALGHAVGEAMAGVKEAKVFRREEALEARFAELSRRSVDRIVREERAAVAHPALMTFVSSLVLAALVLLAAWWQRQGVMEPAAVTRFLVLLALLVAPLQEAMRSFSAVSRAMALLARCDEIAAAPTERDAPGARLLSTPRRGGVAVDFDGVVVRFSDSGFTLGPLTLHVEAGETLVVTGASGSGKSTMLELIPRLADPTAGALRIDGDDVRTLTLASLRAACAFVPQEPYFFAGTIRDNLAFVRPDLDDTALARACRTAHAWEFIERLPQRFDTPVSSGASNLSVGQRQRLALARAILVDPALLLLDEPTAALDPESEALLIASLDEVTEGRSAVIVSHSVAMERLAHRVVRMAHGRVVAIEEGARPLGQGQAVQLAASGT
jgi:ABC-type multidrug transport system fused ATPase/permease subunit